jgi:hypothetical protein
MNCDNCGYIMGKVRIEENGRYTNELQWACPICGHTAEICPDFDDE